MNIKLDTLSPGQAYFHMIQTLVPRPIAWVLSENETGNYNLAPFSYFNAVCSDPPIVMISIGKKPDGSDKDTLRNIRQRKHFNVHIADLGLLEALNQSSATLDANDSELDHSDLTTTEFEGASLPRITQCKIAYGCVLHDIHEIGNTPQAVVYGEIKNIYIDDSIISINQNGRIKVHADSLQPVARLGSNEYMKPGEIIQLNRPD
ncbi:MAG: flavin reductase family protein [Gammaproteobacteria bacterium]